MDKSLMISFYDLKKFVQRLEKEKVKDIETISLPYLLQSLYPKAQENFDERLKLNYTLGYAQGREDALNENKGNR